MRRMNEIDRISCSSYPFINKGLEETFKIVSGVGFKNIDLLGRKPHFDIMWSEEELVKVKKIAESYNLKIANLATYVGAGFGSSDALEREKEKKLVIKAIDAAYILGANSVRGFRSPKYDSPSLIPQITPFIKECADYALEKGIYLSLENHGGELSGSPENCVSLAEAVGKKNFGILYDPCNLYRYGEDYKRAFEIIKDWIVHIHIKDGTKDKDSQKSTMLGKGEIDISWIIKKLRDINYSGYLTLEYEVETVPPERGLVEWYNYMVDVIANV